MTGVIIIIAFIILMVVVNKITNKEERADKPPFPLYPKDPPTEF